MKCTKNNILGILLVLIISTVSIFAQTPTPAQGYTKYLKLKKYRSGAMNIADSLNWNYDQIDTTLRYINDGLNISLDSVSHYYTYLDSIFTEIHQTEDTLQFQAGKIITLNENMDYLNGTVLGLESTVTLLDTAINLESVERVNADTVLSGRIQVQADNIELRVKKDDIISSINLTPEQAKISANKIEIDGPTVFKAISNGQDSTVIDGEHLKTGTVLADTIRSTVFYNKMFLGGTIKGGSIYSRNWTGGGTIGSFFDLDNGYFILGGSSNPKLSWDGTDLNISGNVTIPREHSIYFNNSDGSTLASIYGGTDPLGQDMLMFSGSSYFHNTVDIQGATTVYNNLSVMGGGHFLLNGTDIETLLNSKASSTHTHSVTTRTINYLDWNNEQRTVTVVTGIGGIQ